MTTAPPTLPFTLTRTPRGTWSAKWTERDLGVDVAGSEDAPHPAHVSTLAALVERWPDVERAIESFAVALLPDGRVPLEPASRGGFAAKDCGFDGPWRCYVAILVTAPDAPRHAEVLFYTGLPDGYVNFRVVLDDGRPIAIHAFTS
ncbi:MAG: hypothetical protein M3Y87_36260 [Myxococcota bacterium]|nr:hypothetical protein [Myxococcota bacterium]